MRHAEAIKDYLEKFIKLNLLIHRGGKFVRGDYIGAANSSGAKLTEKMSITEII